MKNVDECVCDDYEFYDETDGDEEAEKRFIGIYAKWRLSEMLWHCVMARALWLKNMIECTYRAATSRRQRTKICVNNNGNENNNNNLRRACAHLEEKRKKQKMK